MDRQKKKGIKVYAVILVLTVAIGVISPHLPPIFPIGGGSPDSEVRWEDVDLDYEMTESAAWTGLAEEEYPAEEKGVLFHNNGQFMDSDLIASEGDCRLVGVYCFKFWEQVPVESYFFSDKPFADTESLLAWILPEQDFRSVELMGRGLDFQAKYFSFAFLDEEGSVQSSLTTRVQGEKVSERVQINGNPGGTRWLIWAYPEMETAASRGISGFSTLLDVNGEDQQLISWDPSSSTVPRTEITFSVGEGLSRTEHYDEIPLMVDSSKSENYGKWTYDIPKFPQHKLSMTPSVEVTNLDEVLVLQLQHTATVNTGIFRRAELDTGRIQIEFADLPASE